MSHGTTETVRVKVEPTEGNKAGIVIINKEDLTADHVVVDEAGQVVQTEELDEDNQEPEKTLEPVKTPWGK